MSHDHGPPELLLLAASIAALAAAPLLHRCARWSPRATRALGIGAAAATVLLVVAEILPECAEAIGYSAYIAAVAGLAIPVVVERRLGNITHGAVPLLAIAALCLHAATDGLAIAGEGHHDHEHWLGLAVVMHRLPVGLALWWLLRPRGRVLAVGALALVAVATIFGYALGGCVAGWLEGALGWVFQAGVAGFLLHVVFHRARTVAGGGR